MYAQFLSITHYVVIVSVKNSVHPCVVAILLVVWTGSGDHRAPGPYALSAKIQNKYCYCAVIAGHN